MSTQRLLILGGTGFVGSHLAARLQNDGWSLDLPTRNPGARRDVMLLPKVRVIAADVHDRARLTQLARGADAVVNLVGILNEPGRDGRGFQRAHVELTATVIEACKAAGVRRLLQMSALNAGRGRSHYLRTRGEAEERVRQSGLDWTIFQPSVIFGPGDGLFTRFAALLKIAPVLPLARANAKFAPVYVGDVVSAFARALHDRATIGQRYELYGPDVMTLREIVAYTAQQMGLRRLVVPLPDALGRLQAALMDFVPGKPFSTDNYLSLQTDSVGGIDGLFQLGIAKTPIASIAPGMLRGSPKQRRLDHNRESVSQSPPSLPMQDR